MRGDEDYEAGIPDDDFDADDFVDDLDISARRRNSAKWLAEQEAKQAKYSNYRAAWRKEVTLRQFPYLRGDSDQPKRTKD